MPISGRFRITSIRLPTHIEAIRPQNSCGLLVITCGPGWMLWIVIAPTISAITALGGMPSVSSGMNEVCAPALLADSGPATPRMAPLPNGTSPGRAASLLLERVGRERRQQRAAAGQDAEHRAERGAAQHRGPGMRLKSSLVGNRPFTLLGEDLAVLGRLAEVGDDLAEAEHAHGDRRRSRCRR